MQTSTPSAQPKVSITLKEIAMVSTASEMWSRTNVNLIPFQSNLGIVICPESSQMSKMGKPRALEGRLNRSTCPTAYSPVLWWRTMHQSSTRGLWIAVILRIWPQIRISTTHFRRLGSKRNRKPRSQNNLKIKCNYHLSGKLRTWSTSSTRQIHARAWVRVVIWHRRNWPLSIMR